ncbi:hypothetical protein [Shewanella frigidimarina]|uniref:hypothetical protein n=1 Tax=Shewanella frigidimarina TaxID=56812 RepID=UPI003D79C15E
MKCTECSMEFVLKDVPLEDRVINAFSTSFKCPACWVLLKPDQRFEIVSNVSILIIGTSIFGFIFKDWLNIGLSYEITGCFGLLGILLWYINSKNIRLEVVIDSA